MISKEVGETEAFPWGYGIAYRTWYKGTAVCYPIPINWVVRFCYHAYIHLSHPGVSGLETLYAKAYGDAINHLHPTPPKQ